MDFPTVVGRKEYTAKGCMGQAATMMEMRVYFMHRHVWDTMVILEEDNLPHPL